MLGRRLNITKIHRYTHVTDKAHTYLADPLELVSAAKKMNSGLTVSKPDSGKLRSSQGCVRLFVITVGLGIVDTGTIIILYFLKMS